jgi:hypothetical protein
MELVRRLKLAAMLPRLRRDQDEQRRFGRSLGDDLEEYDEGAGYDETVEALAEVHDEEEADADVADVRRSPHRPHEGRQG